MALIVNECQAVEDLRWAINSPFLADHKQTAHVAAWDGNVGDATELVEHLLTFDSHRVGRYFEHLVLFYLQNIQRFEILANGLQVRGKQRTIGELDFVFVGDTGHVEDRAVFEGSKMIGHAWAAP